MCNFFGEILKGKKPDIKLPITKHCINYVVNYVVDGNLAIELQYYCTAESEVMARHDFWDTHNGIYHDIISVKVV
jgi:hypothetical protein